MKKWIGILTCFAVTFSSVRADTAPQVPAQEETSEEQEPQKKQVGKAADDGSRNGSGAGKYVVAVTAIAVAIAALVLVSRHHGHNKHGH